MRDLKETEKVLLPLVFLLVLDVCWWAADLPWLWLVIVVSAFLGALQLTISLVALYYLNRAYYHIQPVPPLEEPADKNHPVYRYVPGITRLVARTPLASY